MNSKQTISMAVDYGFITKINALKIINIAKYGRLKCELCEGNLSKYNIDHVVPKSKGGHDQISNLRLTHPKCNSKRGNKFKIKDLIYLLF